MVGRRLPPSFIACIFLGDYMKVKKTKIPDVIIIEPAVFSDNRGFFFESFNQKSMNDILGFKADFVQDNQSSSRINVLRGLHYQIPPYSQAKLVRCLSGEVYDVAVDIRRSSPTFGQWVGVNLSSHNKRQIWIPEGFAHGFLALTDTAEVVYKTTNYYSPNHESGIKWNDRELDISWPNVSNILLSEKDSEQDSFNTAYTFE